MIQFWPSKTSLDTFVSSLQRKKGSSFAGKQIDQVYRVNMWMWDVSFTLKGKPKGKRSKGTASFSSLCAQVAGSSKNRLMGVLAGAQELFGKQSNYGAAGGKRGESIFLWVKGRGPGINLGKGGKGLVKIRGPQKTAVFFFWFVFKPTCTVSEFRFLNHSVCFQDMPVA